MEWTFFESLEINCTLEGLGTADDTDGVGAAEGGRQVDVAFYIYISREDDRAVLIQELDGGAKCVVARRQRVTVKI